MSIILPCMTPISGAAVFVPHNILCLKVVEKYSRIAD